ncbi:MAG TPA: hypothetical protein VGG16_27960 [Streptosporangiaceae bacterium]
MSFRSRTVVLCVGAAAVVAALSASVPAAFGTTASAPKNAVTFKTEHVAGAKDQVLVEGRGLVVYTFTGDKRGKAGTCAGQCAVIWPPLHGIPVLAHGVKVPGKFGRINGQVTYNGWPLYLFIGEKPAKNHADSGFKVVSIQSSHSTAKPAPAPTSTGSW